MATLQWIGGGDNQASAPKDWIDTSTGLHAVPQPGDSLVVGPFGQSYTMNISGNDLAGDTLSQGMASGSLTANLSDQAVVLAFATQAVATFNVSKQSNLTLHSFKTGMVTVNLSQNSTLDLYPEFLGGAAINVSGNDTMVVHGDALGGASFRLAKGSRLSGTFVGAGSVGMDGAAGSAFNNNGHSSFDFPGAVTLGVDVKGTGSITTPTGSLFTKNFRLEFAKSVGPHQSIFDGNIVQIDQPNKFAASITMTAASSEIDLMGLATADSYTYKKDMLNILSGDKIIDTLRLTDKTPYAFDVVKTSGSVNVVALASSGETLQGALPTHIGT
jgi:hypothetical protein